MSDDKPMSQERLQAIIERCAAATPGPWIRDGYGCLPWEISPSAYAFAGKRIVVNPTGENETQMECLADAEFVAHARQDIPVLLAEVERLRGKLWEIYDMSKDAEKRHEKRQTASKRASAN